MDGNESLRMAAERVLASAFGTVNLDAGTPLKDGGRSIVQRFAAIDPAPGAPGSYIVKQAVGLGGPDDDPTLPEGSPTTRFLSEWAGLAFLDRVTGDHPVAPRVHGGDRDLGVLVIEDLGAVRGLNDSLLGDDPEVARADLVAFATTVGRMHARTAPHLPEFASMRAQMGPVGPGIDVSWIVPTFLAMQDALGVTRTGAVEAELAALEHTVENPGGFATFIHSDPCPDNWARVGDKDYLVDFEFAGIGPALQDGVYGQVPFPTCWCIGTIPIGVETEANDAYRQELARGCPAARDEAAYAAAVTEAYVFWLIRLCSWYPLAKLLEEDEQWGTATIRQRLVSRLEGVEAVTSKSGHMAAIGEVAGTMLGLLNRRWEGEVKRLPLYPAFR